MSDIGWISIHRKIAGSWLWEAKPFSYGQAWIDILLECNHKDKKHLIKKSLIEVNRGQSSKSRRTWATRWGWSKSSVDHFFNLLEKDGMIQTENVHVTTRLTVLNYSTYQGTTATGRPQAIQQEGHSPYTNNNVNNGNNDILQAHNAYSKITKGKPTSHELLQLTSLVNEKGAEHILSAIAVCGDHGFYNIIGLKKVLSGEWPIGGKKAIEAKKVKTSDIYRELPDD